MSICDVIVGSAGADGMSTQYPAVQATPESHLPRRLQFQPNNLDLDICAALEQYVDSCFDAWSRLRVGASGTLPPMWRLFPMGKAAHMVAKRMLQPGDICFRVSHRSIEAQEVFRSRYVQAINEFSVLACANLRVRRDVHNCEAYTVVEKARNRTKRIVTYICVQLSAIRLDFVALEAMERSVRWSVTSDCEAVMGHSNVGLDVPAVVRHTRVECELLRNSSVALAIHSACGKRVASDWRSFIASALLASDWFDVGRSSLTGQSGALKEDLASIRASCIAACVQDLQRVWELASMRINAGGANQRAWPLPTKLSMHPRHQARPHAGRGGPVPMHSMGAAACSPVDGRLVKAVSVSTVPLAETVESSRPAPLQPVPPRDESRRPRGSPTSRRTTRVASKGTIPGVHVASPALADQTWTNKLQDRPEEWMGKVQGRLDRYLACVVDSVSQVQRMNTMCRQLLQSISPLLTGD